MWVLDTGVRSTHEQFKGTAGSRAKVVANYIDSKDVSQIPNTCSFNIY